jgi:hypothetical protein
VGYKAYPQVGRSVDIGGRSLNIYCSGDGSPTVVLEHAVGYRWMPIQREVTKFTQACWYDQAAMAGAIQGRSRVRALRWPVTCMHCCEPRLCHHHTCSSAPQVTDFRSVYSRQGI